MPFDPKPSNYFAGINVAAFVGGVTGVFIPWNDLPRFDHNTSGDIRQLFYGLNEKMYQEYSSLPASGKPVEMTISRGQTFPSPTGVRRKYTNSFDLDFVGGYIGSVTYETGLPYPPVITPCSCSGS